MKKHIYVNCLKDVYVMHDFYIISQKHDVITTFHDYMIPKDCCDKYKYVMNCSSDNVVGKLEEYADIILKEVYIIETKITQWLLVLYQYRKK